MGINAADALGDIRIPSDQIDAMINETVSDLEDENLKTRLANDKQFQMQLVALTQNVVVSTSLAQSLEPHASFEEMLSGESFSNGDVDLQRIGLSMIDKIRELPRIQDPDIPDELLKTRFNLVASAI